LQEKIESSTDVLKSIIAPLIDSDEEIVWPPRNPQAFADMRKVSEPAPVYIFRLGFTMHCLQKRFGK
jgi:hypothetical protein